MRRSLATLKSLIDHSDGNLTQFASASMKDALSHLPTISTKPSEWLNTPYPFLHNVHKSWLDAKQIRLYQLSSSTSSEIKMIASQKLWESLTAIEPPSMPFQGSKELLLGNVLSLSPSHLTKLFHFLGLYDLSHELKKTVKAQALQSMQEALTKSQTHFLKKIKPSAVDFGRLDLNQWDGSAKVLQDVLFSRGLNRLAKALYATDSSIAWYLKRMLDKPMADNLSKCMSDLKNPAATKALVKEVQETTDYIMEIVT